jgi:hypothetical protein
MGRADTPPPRPVLLPSIIGLGPPKSGTTALHRCLTSNSFSPPVCCSDVKEPALFTHGRSGGRQWRAHQETWAGKRFAAVLDFTTLYLGAATDVAKRIASFVADPSQLHFVVVLRDPVDRALSQFCMFMPGGSLIENTLRTTTSCRARIGTVCQRRPQSCDGLHMWGDGLASTMQCASVTACLALWRGHLLRKVVAAHASPWPIGQGRNVVKISSACPNGAGAIFDCGQVRESFRASMEAALDVANHVDRAMKGCTWRSKGGLWDQLRQPATLRAIPEAADPVSGAVDPVRLAALATNGSAASLGALRNLRAQVFPFVPRVCSLRSYSWERRNLSFVQMLQSEISEFHTPCDRAAVEMRGPSATTRPLNCASPDKKYGVMDYAMHSTPAPQLDLLLRSFPLSRWTFIPYERLFNQTRSTGETVQWLASLFHLNIANGTRKQRSRWRAACAAMAASKTSRTYNSFRDPTSELDSASKATATSLLAPRYAALLAVIKSAQRRGVRVTTPE